MTMSPTKRSDSLHMTLVAVLLIGAAGPAQAAEQSTWQRVKKVVRDYQPSRKIMAKAGEMDARMRPGSAQALKLAAHSTHLVERIAVNAPILAASILGSAHFFHSNPHVTLWIAGTTMVATEAISRGLQEDFHKGQLIAEAKRRVLVGEAADKGIPFETFVQSLPNPSKYAGKIIAERAKAHSIGYDQMALKILDVELASAPAK
jgi:hypothetical protein